MTDQVRHGARGGHRACLHCCGVVAGVRSAAAQAPTRLTFIKLLTSLEVSISGFVATAGIATPSRISSWAVSQTPVTGPCASGRRLSQLLQKARLLAP